MKRYIPHYLLILAICLFTPVMADALVGPEQSPAPPASAPPPISATATVDKPVPIEPTGAIVEPQAVYPLTADERDIIARIVAGEARGEGPNGMAAVADVILNRLLDGRFGCTVEEVCNAGQFHGLRYKGEIPQDCYDAVDLVFMDGNTGWSCSALYFCTGNPDAIKPGVRETVRIGAHGFYTDKEDKP